MNKLKAIWRILDSDHFYLLTANNNLQITETHSNTDQYTLSTFLHLEWMSHYKGVFLSKPGNEKYV